jgi:hypothetical protein
MMNQAESDWHNPPPLRLMPAPSSRYHPKHQQGRYLQGPNSLRNMTRQAEVRLAQPTLTAIDARAIRES